MEFIFDNYGISNNKIPLLLKGLFGNKKKCTFAELLKALGL